MSFLPSYRAMAHEYSLMSSFPTVLMASLLNFRNMHCLIPGKFRAKDRCSTLTISLLPDPVGPTMARKRAEDSANCRIFAVSLKISARSMHSGSARRSTTGMDHLRIDLSGTRPPSGTDGGMHSHHNPAVPPR